MTYLDFIDSKDIREANKNIRYNVAEQVLIIMFSTVRSVKDKIFMCEQLLEKDDSEFESDKIGSNSNDLKEVLQRTINDWKNVLKNPNKYLGQDKNIFTSSLIEKGFFNNNEIGIFSTYEKALEYLKNKKEKYNKDEYLKNTKTYAYINCITKDLNYQKEICKFIFNSNIDLINIDINNSVNSELTIEDFYLDLKLPFKNGDIVVYDMFNRPTIYGIYNSRPIDDIKRFYKYGDISDMTICLDIFDSESNKFDFIPDIEYLALKKCKPEEIPEDQKILLLMSEVTQGKLNYIYFITIFQNGIWRDLVKQYI